MLLGMITVISVLLAVLEAMGGALWLLPLYFVGNFLGLALVAFLFLVVVSYIVDLDQEQEEDDPFYRQVANLYAEALIQIMQVRVHTRGLEKTPKEGRFLLVCNHQFLADPGVLIHHFKDSQLAFISKQENRDLFCVGRVMHKFLCQTLDRDNDRQALKVILKCIRLIREDKVSIAVFPEGVGVLPWMLCGTNSIGEATAAKMKEFRIVIWGMHGLYGAGKTMDETFGLIETVEKAAQIYMLTAHLPRINTIRDEEMKELAEYFKVNYRKDFLNL